jgi:hypothetical protein
LAHWRVQSNTPFAILTNHEGTMTDQDTVVQDPAEQTPVTLSGLLDLTVTGIFVDVS